jgi:outer membrane protein, multidrug efflux system
MKPAALTKSAAVVLLIAGALAGCASIGPNYKRPAIPMTLQWRSPSEGIGSLADLDWWQLFQDPVLRELYFAKEWPSRWPYHLMANTQVGDEAVAQTILKGTAALEKHEQEKSGDG